ncbi:hypothetical protein O3M35_010644 [Rhynocoris fuscipes]|uniref:Xylulose kinase n=1 Tax=Rhynocoris fuscipes TaxID=488301 RepID=A0AAW1D0P4_9HEMI
MVTQNDLYLGLDFSTQQLKGVIINGEYKILHDAFVEFDVDLPEFRTHKGVVRGAKNTVSAPVLMWVKALDMLLEKLRICGADFSSVVAISGCAQQHGTVYWATGAQDVLKSLTEDYFLHTQLASCFSINNSPIWMDSSTKDECIALEQAIGGPLEVAKITGSKAYERFSAVQIAKIWKSKPTAYKNTERISLISSFACSLFLGRYAPIDLSDGSGMNLLDINTKKWSSKCIQATAPDLENKLGDPVPTSELLGSISPYFCERFGFSEECKIFPFTGDNPDSLAGMCLTSNDIGISLGTSDVLMSWLDEPKVLEEGHILINPISSDKYMAMVGFKNGSLTRERIRNMYSIDDWTEFNRLLDSTPRGNFGYLGLYYDVKEIFPNIEGNYKYDAAGNAIDKFPSSEIEIRALIEGQTLSKRAMIEHMGVHVGDNTKIIVTGGASRNESILQVIADVFGAPVYKTVYANSAALGSAYRAANCSSDCGDRNALPDSGHNLILVRKPYDDCHQVYSPLLTRYKNIIENLLNKGN